MGRFATINFKKWIEEHRDLLKPPVGNQCVYDEAEDFIVMVVGGPNTRKDFHYNEGEEFFYQLEGNMVLKVMDAGKPVDIPINEGEIFLLAAKTPHSPQRPANTVGFVMEMKRKHGQTDGFIWFCENCHQKLFEEYFKLTDIVTQLAPIMERFYQSKELRTCKKCGSIMEPPL